MKTSPRSTSSLLAVVVATTAACCWTKTAMATDLVLAPGFGYTAVEVSSNSSMYTRNDGVMIHEGDHWHDPCDDYIVGVKYTTTNGNTNNNNNNDQETEGDGFIVVNDCQIVRCKKWTTVDGKFGGETVIFDIILDSTEATTAEATATETMRWTVLEEPSTACTANSNCGEDCYTGKFLLVDDYDTYNNNLFSNNCETAASPGSISCVPENQTAVIAPSMNEEEEEDEDLSLSEQVTGIISDTKDNLSPGAIVGIAIAAAVVAALLAFYCFCCRRRKNKNKDTDTDDAKIEEIAARAMALPDNDDTATGTGPSTSAASKNSNRTSWFGGKQTPKDAGSDTDEGSQEEAAAAAASAVMVEGNKVSQAPATEPEPKTTKRGSWFGGGKKAQREAAEPVKADASEAKVKAAGGGGGGGLIGLFTMVAAPNATNASNDIETAVAAEPEPVTTSSKQNTGSIKIKGNNKAANSKDFKETAVPEGTDEVEVTCCGY